MKEMTGLNIERNLSTLNNRLELLIDIVGNRNAFSKIVGISTSGIRRYLDGGEPTVSKLIQISEKMSVSSSWLLTGEGRINERYTNEHFFKVIKNGLNTAQDVFEDYDKIHSAIKSTKLSRKIFSSLLSKESNMILESSFFEIGKEFGDDVAEKVLSEIKAIMPRQVIDDEKLIKIDLYDVSASAGAGALVEYEPNQQVELNDSLIHILGIKNPSRSKMLHMHGDSMAPTLQDGSLIAIEEIEVFFNDGIYVFSWDGCLFIKRLQRTKNGIVVISDNQAYQEWQITREEMCGQVFTVHGRVTGCCQKL